MTYVRCGACVSPWDCGMKMECLNCLVTARQQIADGLAAYDAKREALAVERAASVVWAKPVEKKAPEVKPWCPHAERSGIGICLACGDWK